MKKFIPQYLFQLAANKASMLFILTTSILLVAVQTTMAQKKWSFELKPGVDFATKDLGNTNLKTGFGIEGIFAYKVMPHLATYAGWSWNRFPADQAIAGNTLDFEETGYCVGLQFIHPIGKSAVNYMIKGGGIYNHIEIENSDGKIINDSGHGIGWQLGVGASIPLGKRFSLIPELRYRSLSRDIKIYEAPIAVDLNYISAGVGFAFNF